MSVFDRIADIFSNFNTLSDFVKKWRTHSKTFKTIAMSILLVIISIIIALLKSDKENAASIVVDNSTQTIINQNNANATSGAIIQTKDSPIASMKVVQVNNKEPSYLNGFSILSTSNTQDYKIPIEDIRKRIQAIFSNDEFLYTPPVNKNCFQEAFEGKISCIRNNEDLRGIRYLILVKHTELVSDVASYAGMKLVTMHYDLVVIDNKQGRIIKSFQYENRASNINSRLAREELMPLFLDSISNLQL